MIRVVTDGRVIAKLAATRITVKSHVHAQIVFVESVINVQLMWGNCALASIDTVQAVVLQNDALVRDAVNAVTPVGVTFLSVVVGAISMATEQSAPPWVALNARPVLTVIRIARAVFARINTGIEAIAVVMRFLAGVVLHIRPPGYA